VSPLFYVALGILTVLFIVIGLLARSEEGRQISWSIAAIIYLVASLTAYAVP